MVATDGTAWAQGVEGPEVTVDPMAASRRLAPEVSHIFGAEMLPAGGAGFRYQLTRDYPMHLCLNHAWGRDGGLLCFSVGEAF